MRRYAVTRIIERPEVFLISQPKLEWNEIARYLKKVGERTETDVLGWYDRVLAGELSDGEALVEFGGRLCYRSWVPGANVNVSKVRESSEEYLGNILKSGHGSVLEHANYSFIFDDVSRVFTHEQVRHRAGVAISQESMRFVRLTDIPFWFPEWALEDRAFMANARIMLEQLENFQLYMAKHFKLDDEGVPFSEKKHKTSFMRRFAPDGVATGMLCTINVRALRHIVYMRTALGAEEEIRLVMDDVARLAQDATPNLMQDYSPNEDLEWVPDFLKV
jgi:thymidylate synthase (FAD)